ATTIGMYIPDQKEIPDEVSAESRPERARKFVDKMSTIMAIPTPPTFASTPSRLPKRLPMKVPISRLPESRATPRMITREPLCRKVAGGSTGNEPGTAELMSRPRRTPVSGHRHGPGPESRSGPVGEEPEQVFCRPVA